MREEWEYNYLTIYKCNAAMCNIVYLHVCKFVHDFILRGAVNRRLRNSVKRRSRKMGVFVDGGGGGGGGGGFDQDRDTKNF